MLPVFSSLFDVKQRKRLEPYNTSGERLMNKEEWEQITTQNAEILRKEIESLKTSHQTLTGCNYKSFWNHVKEINHTFKTHKPLRKEDRQELWSTFQRIIDDTEHTQNQEYEKRKNDSRQKRELVEMKIMEAHNYARGATTKRDIFKAKDLLNEAMQRMKDGWSGFTVTTEIFTFSEGKMNKADNDGCWEQWKTARDTLRYKQDSMCDLNFSEFKSEAYKAIDTARHDPREAKNMVKQIQSDLRNTYMKKHQYEEVRTILDEAWRKASAEQQQAHEAWRERMEGCIERW